MRFPKVVKNRILVKQKQKSNRLPMQAVKKLNKFAKKT
ncbi:hypothetical protein F544_18520 [Bibersteinia trehalosi USDA-ARS-USMARC-190]|uniref:Uncharacterized protein n=1 Tax=Bibersteinia trehalosi USDA-ARS-USMARC-190 TaxID=1263832 RepID=W0R7G6_BIBTR|nr:hypothetical protein F544_18520 [Bibersteinia trehalosi USDA-ARS-USMARC-190]